MLGVMSLREALNLAYDKDLDLVQLSYEDIPTCKICHFGQYKYDLDKKNKNKSKNNKTNILKFIKITLNIGEADLKVKSKKILQFIEEGSKVQVSIRLKGRENIKPENGIETLNKLIQFVILECNLEKPPTHVDREIYAILSPKKKN
ncbi:translation initiation factor IF-3 [Rickettsiales bacterium (ex Bugula neritina AB1)]|nr:translation initiation factor IF-3 [Rickettsiales bacterium (ex Bugula neritina AB1)]